MELAAARVRVLSPEKLLARLSQRFKLLSGGRRDQAARQATLRGAIDWSWELLKPWEQAALAQCSVFRGGFTLEAAEAVLDLESWEEAPWAMDVVQSLVDQSMLRIREPRPGCERFGLYESIREYASEKLATAGASTTPDGRSAAGPEVVRATHGRHAEHYAAFGTEEHLESLHVHGGVERQRVLEMEMENLVAAVVAHSIAFDYSPSLDVRQLKQVEVRVDLEVVRWHPGVLYGIHNTVKTGFTAPLRLVPIRVHLVSQFKG